MKIYFNQEALVSIFLHLGTIFEKHFIKVAAQDVSYFNIANLKCTLLATIKYKSVSSIPNIRKVRDKISLSSDFDCFQSHGFKDAVLW